MSLDELLGAAQRLVDTGVTPACQLAVARDGELLAFETFGAATNDSQFCAFSATKPIVASMVWLLIGEGSIAPEQRVADLVPEFATNGKDAITLDQVLLHTAGFPNAPLDHLGADPDARRAAFARWTLEWEPGTRFEYHATLGALGPRRPRRAGDRARLPGRDRTTRHRAARAAAAARVSRSIVRATWSTGCSWAPTRRRRGGCCSVWPTTPSCAPRGSPAAAV